MVISEFGARRVEREDEEVRSGQSLEPLPGGSSSGDEVTRASLEPGEDGRLSHESEVVRGLGREDLGHQVVANVGRGSNRGVGALQQTEQVHARRGRIEEADARPLGARHVALPVGRHAHVRRGFLVRIEGLALTLLSPEFNRR